MAIPPNHLDAQRRLQPHHYAVHPERFGRQLDLSFRQPPDGDWPSLLIAQLGHLLLAEWQGQHGRHPSAQVLCQNFGGSPPTFSRTVTAVRWPGETYLAALVYATRPDLHHLLRR